MAAMETTVERHSSTQRWFVYLLVPVLVWIMFAFVKTSHVFVGYSDVVEQDVLVLQSPDPSVVYIDGIAMAVNPRFLNPDDPGNIRAHPKSTKSKISPPKLPAAPKAPPVIYEEPKLPDNFWKFDPNPQFYFQFPMNHADFCHKETPENMVLVMVLSAPNNIIKREKIRKSWGKSLDHHGFLFKTLFLLGDTKDQKILDKLKAENEKYEDIVQANFTDVYRNLTYKTLSGLSWTREYCKEAAFVFKLDDDVKTSSYARIVRFIESRATKNDSIKKEVWCLGPAFNKPSPIRAPKSKWLASVDIYPERFYPYLCLGSYGYVITREAVQGIIDTSHRTKFFWLEDVYVTGILRQLTGNTTIKALPK